MYNLVDNLIFPAPTPGYDPYKLKNRLIYIPKFKDYFGQMRKDAAENRKIKVASKASSFYDNSF